MKKTIAIVMAAVMLLCTSALAANVSIVHSVNMEDLDNCTLHVGFDTDLITDIDMVAQIYDPVAYDIADVSQLQVGDVIETEDGDVTVETIEIDETGDILINNNDTEIDEAEIDENADGDECCAPDNSVTLFASDTDNCYYKRDYETVSFMMMGEAQLMFADEVEINVYKMDESLAITDEGYDTVKLPAADVKEAMVELGKKFYDSHFSPYQATVVMENGLLTTLTIDYMP